MDSPFKILLADDHVMFRRGVRRIIQGIDNVEVVGEASDGLELLRLLKDLDPNLVIMDISMPNLRGSGGHPGDQDVSIPGSRS